MMNRWKQKYGVLLKQFLVMSMSFWVMISYGQSYPTKPVHFVVAFTPGSGTDIIARAVGDVIGESIGQPIVVENKPGAGGTIAASQVAKAEADGYTLLVHSSGHTLNPAIYPNLPYDTLKDLTGIIPLAQLPNVLVVAPNRGWNTVADLVAAAKASPGSMNYASAGIGSATHMNVEKFNLSAGIKATHVPYKGTPEALTDVMGGRADWYFAPLSTALPLIQTGKLKALAVSTPKRAASLPNVPTTEESGYANSAYIFWVGLIAPANTPAQAIKKLNDEVTKAMSSGQVKERFAKLGAEPFTMSSDAFNAMIKNEMESAAKLSKVVQFR